MATLVLQAAGTALGGLLGPVGALVGGALGALGGSVVDQSLFGTGRSVEGPRLDSVAFQGGAEGTPLPRVYGRARLAGTVIWARPFEEVASRESVGGKGGGSGTTATSYSYFADFAVALCDGPIHRVARIWADGEPLDLTRVTLRVHRGSEDQAGDPLIAAKEGAAPAFRGTAYIVFERLPLEAYGNRLPQLSFEVIRVVDALEPMIRAVTLIPGATEYGYETVPVRERARFGGGSLLNRHIATGHSDLESSLDDLQSLCPNLEKVALVTAWFGDDLRAGHCRLKPKVESRTRVTRTRPWIVSGVERSDAEEVSRTDGASNYGGTPADSSVIAGIKAIKARGLRVTLYPFIMMDVPADNDLPDPYGGARQAAFPWRGRITLATAPGRSGSTDRTAAAAAEIATFVGTTRTSAFRVSGGQVAFTGSPTDWSYRRLILHYAHLAVAAGGVDAFLIGAEMRGLTTARSGRAEFPFVQALMALAADVRSILGPGTAIGYGADWSEYFGHHPQDGSGDVLFHLDPLWASPDVDFVGIDAYWPLADWRDGAGGDAARAPSTYDLDHLAGNVAGGEGYDWFYASVADRVAGVRTPIADGAYGKPWTFRYKDVAAWWSNLHVDRIGGVENAGPTPWRPQMKPIRLTEAGCPAIDRGANQPNVFIDPKSAESFAPYFSNGARDDAIQRRYLEALIGALDPASPRFDGTANPAAGAGGRMIDPSDIHLWTWDARPWPAFPRLGALWADGGNWERGHWLTGRLGGTTLAGLVRAIAADRGFTDFVIDGLDTVIDGYVIDRPMSARDAIAPLATAFGFTVADAGDRLRFRSLDRLPDAALGADDLVEDANGREPSLSITRTQDSELPRELRIDFLDSGRDHRATSTASRRLEGATRRIESLDLAVAASADTMQRAAEAALHDRWTARERLAFALGPSRLALEPGDVVTLAARGAVRTLLIEQVEDDGTRKVNARLLDRSVFRTAASGIGVATLPTLAAPGPPLVEILDLPPINEDVAALRPWIAASAEPWGGPYAVMRSATGDGFERVATIERAAAMGSLTAPLGPGPIDRWDRASRVRIESPSPFASLAEAAVLAGGNALAVRSASGLWEIVQFCTATLVGAELYELSGLLRAQLGTEEAMIAGHPAGAPAVLLDAALVPLPLTRAEIGRDLFHRIVRPGTDIADETATAVEGATRGRGLRPFSPVHLRMRRDGGDRVFTWIRRTRLGGDDWSAETVPLGEESELYRIEVVVGDAVVRRLDVAEPRWRYAAAEAAADFGGAPPAGAVVRVAQIAAGYGAGTAREIGIDG
ncbi:baseplate multidomain protein megatron [Segnochrobactrum spirostomi]|uniref:Host specificity protein n=1 Tax=Segnochrobactrum spirostomi TaxID=2608987 RepID=A0A6A7Y0P6_9HYPH|nr:glycoside hydrolase/phage tail family protein [Segnochrobactrum spirostomi]MQT12315.1 hypothetical protein [Segnochrobactrum spirostomi]